MIDAVYIDPSHVNKRVLVQETYYRNKRMKENEGQHATTYSTHVEQFSPRGEYVRLSGIGWAHRDEYVIVDFLS